MNIVNVMSWKLSQHYTEWIGHATHASFNREVNALRQFFFLNGSTSNLRYDVRYFSSSKSSMNTSSSLIFLLFYRQFWISMTVCT